MRLPIFTLAGLTFAVSPTGASSTSQLPTAQLSAALALAPMPMRFPSPRINASLRSRAPLSPASRCTKPGNGHHLADLGNSMSKSFARGFGWLFSPAAPLGLVAIPATIAWGAVAAPFCLLGDLGDDGAITQDIKVSD